MIGFVIESIENILRHTKMDIHGLFLFCFTTLKKKNIPWIVKTLDRFRKKNQAKYGLKIPLEILQKWICQIHLEIVREKL